MNKNLIKFLFLDPETSGATVLGSMVSCGEPTVTAVDTVWDGLEETDESSRLIAELIDENGTTTEVKHITMSTLSLNIGKTLTDIITKDIIPERELVAQSSF